MKRRTLICYTPEQKAIIWDRYKQDDPLHDIARMFDRFNSSIMLTIYQKQQKRCWMSCKQDGVSSIQ